MMVDSIFRFERRARLKLFCLLGGMTAGTGALLLSQGCPGGQCAACGGQCTSRLPLLALPLLVQGVIALSYRVRRTFGQSEARPDNTSR